ATKVYLGLGQDDFHLRVTSEKSDADSIDIHGGAAPGTPGEDLGDTSVIETTGVGATTVIDGDAGDDPSRSRSGGERANTQVSGDDGNDTVTIKVATLPETATTTLHGDAHSTGDTLIIDPQDPDATFDYRADSTQAFATTRDPPATFGEL